jgi:hypothetical protein
MNQLDQENGDYDLTSSVTVLTDTPDATNPKVCQAYLAIGDGTKDLDGTGGDFEVVITVGSQTLEPSPQTITFSTATRVCLFTHAFPVPANTQVTVALKSPNAGDDDVDVTATLYDVTGGTDQSGDTYAYLGTNVGANGVNLTAITGLALGTTPSTNLEAMLTAMSTGTAQAGAASTITLAAGANANDDFYNGATVTIYGGTGAGQTRQIQDYNGTSKVATVNRAWAVTPSTDSTYLISPNDWMLAITAQMLNSVITAAAFDSSTAYPLTSQDSGATAVMRAGADSDTGKTLSDQLDTVTTNTASKTGYKLASDGLDLVLCGGVALPTTLKRIGAAVAPSKSEAPSSTAESFYWNSVKVMTLTYSTSGDRHYVDSTVYH